MTFPRPPPKAAFIWSGRGLPDRLDLGRSATFEPSRVGKCFISPVTGTLLAKDAAVRGKRQ